MNVLSLFDGISCGQLALKRVGLKYDNYYASEVDKYAIKVTQHNFPNTIQIGDVTKVKVKDLPKIDLLIGGSPCQGFSFAGKQLNFKDPRSSLFFEYVRLLKELNPKYFLLENVLMKKEFQTVITEHLGVEPIMINSSLVSAQNRKRLYWTNIPNVKQPEDRNIYLENIIDSNINNWRELDSLEVAIIYKTLNINLNKIIFIGGFHKGLRLKNGKCLSRNYREGYRIYSIKGKSSCLLSQSKGGQGGYSGLYGKIFSDKILCRRLTPLECKRLQTVPDDYKMNVSDTQAYKMLGNGWTVEVVAHIFKGLT